MFGKKKKSDVKTLTHPDLGEMHYSAVAWKPDKQPEIVLWDKTYKIDLLFMALSEEEKAEGVTLCQVEAFERFQKTVTAQKDEIEKLILKHIDTDGGDELGERIIPRCVSFSRSGECAVEFEDKEEGVNWGDDPEYGFAVFLIPRLIFCPEEQCVDFMNECIGMDEIEELNGAW